MSALDELRAAVEAWEAARAAAEEIEAELAHRRSESSHFQAEYEDACAELDRLRAGIQALADEWDQAAVTAGYGEYNDGRRDTWRGNAASIRALLDPTPVPRWVPPVPGSSDRTEGTL